MVKNPRELSFESDDHDHQQVTGYEVDIAKANPDGSPGERVDTIETGKGEVKDGRVVLGLNVQPRDFGSYVFVVRARTNNEDVESDSSDPSDVWQRAPGKPRSLQVGI